MDGVNRREALDGLQLDNDAIAHDQVDIMPANRLTLIFERDGNLSSKRDCPPLQLDAQRSFVYRLDEPRPEPPMHLDTRANNRRRNRIHLFVRLHARLSRRARKCCAGKY